MFEEHISDPGSLPKWLVVVSVIAGQARNIVLLLREVRTWWRKPGSTKKTGLPPHL